MDVETYEYEDGSIDIFVGEGLSLVDNVLYEVSYQKIGSLQTLVEDSQISPIELYAVRPDGTPFGQTIALANGGTSSEIIPKFTSGKMAGLLALRDQVFPEMLAQLDNLASELRDRFNEIHNNGSSYPGTSELTGTRAVNASDRSAWEGSVRIALLDKQGYAVPSVHPGETSDFRPLTIDLSELYNGTTTYGEPDVQAIIDEINNHYGIPQNQLRVGNFNQIQLALMTDRVPGASPSITFDFDIENISDDYGDFWVNNVQVLDDTGADITLVTDTMPSVALDAAATFITTANSSFVEITTAAPHSFQIGDRVHLDNPGATIDGIPGASFSDYFVITAITSNTFTVDIGVSATAGMTTGVAAQEARPPYATVEAGDKTRLYQDGSITANLTGNSTSDYYDIRVTMGVRHADGTLGTTTATYRVTSPNTNTRNDRISATEVPISDQHMLITPSTTQGYLRAILVDENGDELPMTNGEYGEQEGYLKLVSLNPDYVVAIDEMDSKQMGRPNDVPPVDGSERRFSHYFELNNFFQSNLPIITGDTVKNSALNMAVESRMRSNPSLISTGTLQLSNQPVDPDADPLYTYERFSGDNSVAQNLAGLGLDLITFSSAGGLPEVNLSFNGYASEMLGFMTTTAISARANLNNDEILLKGYTERADAISGVNLDEELANTIIYQNAYTASARVIRITDELFDALLQL
jgi:flagellar hook-associated protein FlgK